MSIKAKFKVDRGGFKLHVDVDIPGTGVTALFGPSGSGKTTLLRAIAGLEHYPDGYLRVGEHIWQDAGTFLSPHHRPLGYVIQEAGLFPHLTVQANLEYGYKRLSPVERKITPDKAIAWLNIAHLLKRKPGTLSGGERQRVAIARALAVSPGLLLMDEPLASLDQQGKHDILPYLDRLHDELDIPVIYVSHNLDEVTRLADHMLLLQSGQVLASGSCSDILTRLDIPLARGQDAVTIIEGQITGYDETYHLNILVFDGGELVLPGNKIPRGQHVRIRLLARDVSLGLDRSPTSSIQNTFPAVVEDIYRDGALVTVRLMVSNVPLLSRITLKSLDTLGLKPGKTVYAQVKSAVLVV